MNIFHGVNFTVNVTNTLSGATQIFDSCDGTSDPTAVFWNYVWHSDPGEDGSQWAEKYRTPTNSELPSSTGPALPHSRGTKYLCGAAQSNLGGIYSSEVAVLHNYTAPALPYYVNFSWWEHVDSRYVFNIGSPSNDNNYKWCGLTCEPNNLTPGSGRNWYLCAQLGPEGFVDNISDVKGASNDDSSSNDFFAYSNGPGPNPEATWIYRQIKIKLASTAAGYVKGFVNKPSNVPVQDIGISGVTDNYGGTTRGLYVGGYNRNYPNSNNWRYWKDITVDHQATDDGELVLTDNATYLSGTKFVHQARVSATGTTSTHKCYGGVFPANTTVHMHWRSEVNGNSYLGTAILDPSGSTSVYDEISTWHTVIR